MREVTKVDDIDDVVISMPIRRLKVILRQIDRMRAAVSESDNEWWDDRQKEILEYARTGKIAAIEQTICEVGLAGHGDECTIWSHGKIMGGECSCGRWEVE